MAWTTYQLCLAGMMVVTGSINTLSAKWADKLYAVGIDGRKRIFDHPFLQACGMFLGELSCLVVFNISLRWARHRGRQFEVGDQSFPAYVFLPAALCDMCATSLMYVGLNLTYASSFQMLRGAVIIFTALLSVAFLGRVIKSHMWFGMSVILLGLVLVGLSDILFGGTKNTDTNGIIAGDLLIIMAQIITACQMVYEEKFVYRYNIPPMQAVGLEGFFGFFILGVLLIPMYFIRIGHPFSNDPEGRMENALDAFVQMGNNFLIIIATLGNVLSIAFFNFAGISVTKELSATTRMVLDSVRTLVIWGFSLAVQWQIFTYKSFLLQLAGFALLISGMCIYNNLVFKPLLRKCFGVVRPPPSKNEYSEVDTETSPLLRDNRTSHVINNTETNVIA